MTRGFRMGSFLDCPDAQSKKNSWSTILQNRSWFGSWVWKEKIRFEKALRSGNWMKISEKQRLRRCFGVRLPILFETAYVRIAVAWGSFVYTWHLMSRSSSPSCVGRVWQTFRSERAGKWKVRLQNSKGQGKVEKPQAFKVLLTSS